MNVLQVVDGPGNFVEPTIVSGLSHDDPLVLRESFVPVLYVLKLEGDLDRAISYNNEVDQGLTSSVFTKDLSNVFRWLGWAMYLLAEVLAAAVIAFARARESSHSRLTKIYSCFGRYWLIKGEILKKLQYFKIR